MLELVPRNEEKTQGPVEAHSLSLFNVKASLLDVMNVTLEQYQFPNSNRFNNQDEMIHKESR